MRPYILQGHTRPLNQVSFTREGDFLITCGKDSNVNLWWADNGERAGTFNGHNGAVWTTDTTYDTSVLMTGDTMAAISTDPFMDSVSAIRLVKIADDSSEQSGEVLASMTGPRGRITRILWTDLNKTLISTSEDGCVRRWDVETGKMIQEEQVHKATIGDMQMSVDGTHIITASADQSAKILDSQTLQELKTFSSQVPINSAALSPTHDHVLIGGGQEASKVTTTSDKAGHFEARFFHKIYKDEFANVSGHFGPINTVAFTPDGTGFASGGEEGYVRLHHFDADYFTGGN
eukprot:jgi/Picre1/33642/NNA_001122.t1